MIRNIFFLLLTGIFISGCTGNIHENVEIPLPSAPQLRWQKYKKTMFVCLDPCTWQGREYDNHSIPLSRINPASLNTDQWCETAELWGAKLILFVAKHTGGFCWWRTNTTDYGIKNTPWRGGEGDVLKDLSESCRKYGLDLGIYVYPGDETWGAGIGSGGLTKDPEKQEGYNRIFRQQMTEVLTKYGPVREVWFDGSCHIDVNDILGKYASDAVILQGPMANLRWVGNESGYAPFSNWYTLSREDLQTGVATAIQSDPFGNAYAPVEIDVPLLKNKGHKWFWAPGTDHLILTTDQLMDIYYKSVGRGAVLLLNSTPDTTGLIPQSHILAYKAFGEEIKRRFDNPLKKTSGKGRSLDMKFTQAVKINHVILQEELAEGQRVLAFVIEGMDSNNNWRLLYEGTSVGSMKICYFDRVPLRKIRVQFTNIKAEPHITNFAVYDIEGVTMPAEKRNDRDKFYDGIARRTGTEKEEELPVEIGTWDSRSSDKQGWNAMSIDLTKFLNRVGQYEVKFSSSSDVNNAGLEFKDWEMEMYGSTMKSTVELLKDGSTFRITRSQHTLDEFPSIFRVKIKSRKDNSSGTIMIRELKY